MDTKMDTNIAMHHEESAIVQQKIDELKDTISHLRQKVIWLEEELAQAHHFANHDELTGLPNRSLLRDRLNQAVMQAVRKQKQVGLLLLDLDEIKSVNDRLGHAIGDKLLQAVAKRLLSCIRNGDTACRYDRYEFIILLPDIDSEKNAEDVVQKLRTQLARPYLVDQHTVTVTASIGMAVHPFHKSGKKDLIQLADIAMYLAKAHKNSRRPSLQSAGN
jgi:diguanylate cyclase (GGDEF)-like protein